MSLAAAGFAIVCLFQWKQINKLKKQTFLLHQTVEERDRKDEATHAKLRAVQRERSELSYRVDTLTNDLQALRATAVHRQVNPSSAGTQSAVVTDQEKHKGGFADWIARMIDDPAMKQMIRDQQAVMLDSTYGPLFKEMGLSPEDRVHIASGPGVEVLGFLVSLQHAASGRRVRGLEWPGNH